MVTYVCKPALTIPRPPVVTMVRVLEEEEGSEMMVSVTEKDLNLILTAHAHQYIQVVLNNGPR